MERLIIMPIIVFTLFTLTVPVYGKATIKNIQSEISNSEKSLTLREAIKIAQEEAIMWNKEARVYFAISVDRDKTPTGMDGRRKHWNIQFGIPGKTDWYLVTIRDGEVGEKLHLPEELKPMPESYFLSYVEEIQYDTPELLMKAQNLVQLYPGDTFAKGYNFGFTKDPQKNMPLVMVIGWDWSKQNMIYLLFNAKTGGLEQINQREQYRN